MSNRSGGPGKGPATLGGRSLVVCLPFLAVLAGAHVSAEEPAGQLKVMTFNLATPATSHPTLGKRGGRLPRNLDRKQNPDLIGTQEGLWQQVKDLEADLPDYAWIGLGRDGGSRGEFMAIYYRRARLKPWSSTISGSPIRRIDRLDHLG